MTRRELEQRLRGMAWPAASAELRARVVRAAPPAGRRIAWIDRLWFSRAWRLSMAAAAVLVVLGGQWAAAPPKPPVPPDVPLVETQTLERLVQQSGIPAADAASLVRRTMGRRRAAGSSAAIIDLVPLEGARQ